MDPWIALLDDAHARDTRVSVRRDRNARGRSHVYGDRNASARTSRWSFLGRARTGCSHENKRTYLSSVSSFLNWLIYHWELGNIAKAELVVDEMRTIMHDRNIPPI